MSLSTTAFWRALAGITLSVLALGIAAVWMWKPSFFTGRTDDHQVCGDAEALLQAIQSISKTSVHWHGSSTHGAGGYVLLLWNKATHHYYIVRESEDGIACIIDGGQSEPEAVTL